MADLRQRRAKTTALPDAWSPGDQKDAHASRRGRRHTASTIPRAGLLVVAFLIFHAAVFATVAHFHSWLPPPQPLDAPSNVFSEARARVVLEKIMSFGYRPVGSKANDELTPAYLLSEIEKIKAAAPPGVSIEVDVQKPTGAFGLNFLAQFQNIYANVTNIVVRLATTTPPPGVDVLSDSLMISSHYDAAIGGAAASDDGVNIAIMMELLRYFAQEPPTHGSLIFNFNGAEETIMQAAHGFITQHKWTKHIRAFINLEAAGAGGRELLFQTGSDELVLAYAEGASYPHASIIAQELFQTGVIPADTDFRVYRDFGAVAGMDFAYISNGYVYHTKLDDISRIEQGAVQRLGDNLVGVVQRLTNEPGRLAKIAATPHSSNTLFFDVAGLFMISMGRTTALSLCWGVVAVAILYLLQSPLTFQERTQAIKLMWRCVGAGLGASLLTAVVLTLFAPLSWYTVPYLGAAAFLAPALAGMLDRLASFLEDKTSRMTKGSVSDILWRIEESLFEAMLSTWLFALVVMLSLNAISSYILAVWVLFPLLGQIGCHALQRLKLLPPTLFVVASLAAVAVPVVHSGFVLTLAFVFFIPLMGRCGGVPPPDVLLAIVFGASLMILLSYSSRFFCFVSVLTLRRLRNLLIAMTVGVVLVSTTLNPYSDITPKRVMVQHMHREFVLPNGTITTQDAGLWINTMDFRGVAPLKPFLKSTQWGNASLFAPPPTLTDTFDIYGDVPYGLPVRDFVPERLSWYLLTAPPVFSESEPQPHLEVLSSTYDASTNRRTVHLQFTGPAHLDLFIDATKTTLTSWSIGEGVSGPAPHSDGTYILHFATGTPPANFEFWLEAEGDNGIEVGVVGHHLEKQTPQMREFVAALPPWCDALEFVSTWSTRTI